MKVGQNLLRELSFKCRWFMLGDGKIFFFRTQKEMQEGASHKSVPLITSTVKPSMLPKCFELVSMKKTYLLQAETLEGDST